MSNIKEISFDSLNMPEIPDTITLSIENIDLELLPDYIVEKKNGIAPFCFEPHKHLAYELTIIEEGKLSIRLSGETLSLSKGEYVLIPPNIEHNLIAVSDGIRRFRLRFMPISEIEVSLPSAALYIRGEFRGKKSELIFSLINDLCEIEADGKNIAAKRYKSYELAIILSHAIEKLYGTPIHAAAPHVGQAGLRAKIESYMYLNYNRPITLELLAENLSYSRTQMRRIIEECFGMPFTEKLREIRLNAAKKHLIDGKLAIEEIAEACGYETRQGFEAMFLKYVGKTPNQYRRHH